jgi:hypothetical protein
MTAHRYWRLFITTSISNFDSQAAEIELRETASGSDVTGSGTASANSTEGGWPASNAFDNNNSTAWNSAGFAGVPVWIAYDFGSGNDKDIVEFTLRVRSDYAGNAPKDFSLQYSDDGVTWYSKISPASQTGWSTGEVRTFTYAAPSNSHRYWRIFMTEANAAATSFQICKMELRGSAGGSDITGSGTATASSTRFDSSPDNPFDSDGTTYWDSNTAGGHWLKYDFGSAQTVAEVAIIFSTNYTGSSPPGFQIQSSDDDTTWATWFGVSGYTGHTFPGERKVIQPGGFQTDSAIANPARYWRLLVDTITSGSLQGAVAEMEMRSSTGGADQTGSGSASNGTGVSAGNDFSDAFDNNNSTIWAYSVVTASPRMWGWYDFGSGVTKSIVEIALRSSASNSGNDAPTAFRLQRSDDKIRWASPTIDESGVTGWSAGQTRYFDSTGEVSGSAPPTRGAPCFVCT